MCLCVCVAGVTGVQSQQRGITLWWAQPKPGCEADGWPLLWRPDPWLLSCGSTTTRQRLSESCQPRRAVRRGEPAMAPRCACRQLRGLEPAGLRGVWGCVHACVCEGVRNGPFTRLTSPAALSCFRRLVAQCTGWLGNNRAPSLPVSSQCAWATAFEGAQPCHYPAIIRGCMELYPEKAQPCPRIHQSFRPVQIPFIAFRLIKPIKGDWREFV